MASVNKVIILGNVGGDPEVREAASGKIVNLSIATSRRYKTASGERVDETEWHRVVFFGKVADVASQYVHKGDPLYVEGRLQTRKWQDKSGQDRYTTEIVCEQMQLLGGKADGAQESRPVAKPAAARPAPASAQRRPAPAPAAFDDEDCPF